MCSANIYTHVNNNKSNENYYCFVNVPKNAEKIDSLMQVNNIRNRKIKTNPFA